MTDEILREDDIDPFNADTLESAPALTPGEILIGTFSGFDEQHRPIVKYHGCHIDAGVSAVSTISLEKQHFGMQVALMFVDQDIHQPIVMGVVRSQLMELLDTIEIASRQPDEVNELPPQDGNKKDATLDNVLVDGNKVTIEGKDEIVLRCGESSITLTKSGKILIRGRYLLNRSTGVNRILGGSVQVN